MKYLITAFVLAICLIDCPAFSAINIELWPINQHINTGETSSVLWLKNTGNNNANLSIRVLSWEQKDGDDYFSDQQNINIVPPLVAIMPADKEFVRFLTLPEHQTKEEQAYRIIVDEIPDIAASNTAKVALRMRYVLPFFIAGQKTPMAFQSKGDALPESYPVVKWHFTTHKGKQVIALQNVGPVHARLENLALQNTHNNNTITLKKGLYGYILPGATMYLPLPANFQADHYNQLTAYFFDGDKKPTVLTHN